ncbi:putative quinol monooxygenase [Corynebacterium liangguodongii]|uniref:Antibiotic biosynthesis monooxygenase n=1 Tax=Corynebacterium liangguodongii TaxID=2079535 RepID=A0A2S0WD48_9CORY|nr:putative quinol monooxygenase [Corynebacterium liangguodongii]AWB83695.1 antibiotic biosynthesis monooxygenase [Corynebacterium liangguodongii]PWB99495.1 antibiotic biosynthesis monooxygenase [Corynebacterium liangguodongii]
MILINVKFQPLPEHVENFRELVADFTDGSRAEEGNLFFDWYRSEEDPNEYLLVEAYVDGAAKAHVTSPHFRAAQEYLPKLLTKTPQVINHQIDGKTEWDELVEFRVEQSR